jgi:hypothetical protein
MSLGYLIEPAMETFGLALYQVISNNRRSLSFHAALRFVHIV